MLINEKSNFFFKVGLFPPYQMLQHLLANDLKTILICPETLKVKLVKSNLMLNLKFMQSGALKVNFQPLSSG